MTLILFDNDINSFQSVLSCGQIVHANRFVEILDYYVLDKTIRECKTCENRFVIHIEVTKRNIYKLLEPNPNIDIFVRTYISRSAQLTYTIYYNYYIRISIGASLMGLAIINQTVRSTGNPQ